MSGIGGLVEIMPANAPRIIHCALSTPEQNDHLPESFTPPGAGSILPDGAKLDAESVRSFAQYSCCAFSGKSATKRSCTPITVQTQPAEPSPRDNSDATSKAVSTRTSGPPNFFGF